jgi:hypothetical protein
MLPAQTDAERIRDALWRFYDAAAAADMPETTRLATTIKTWRARRRLPRTSVVIRDSVPRPTS